MMYSTITTVKWILLTVTVMLFGLARVDAHWTTMRSYPTTKATLVFLPTPSFDNQLVKPRRTLLPPLPPPPPKRITVPIRSTTIVQFPRTIGTTTLIPASYSTYGHHETGICSWYRDGYRTANGERFDPNGMTAAHPTLPFNSMVKVTAGTRSVLVRINDRGPGVKGRILDLSYGAAKHLRMIRKGLVRCQVNLHR